MVQPASSNCISVFRLVEGFYAVIGWQVPLRNFVVLLTEKYTVGRQEKVARHSRASYKGKKVRNDDEDEK